MRICMISEGSYPYITGGVSSWIHTLVTSMPEHEFIIYAIGAEEKLKGKFKYKLPANIIEVKEVFLDSFLKEEGEWGKKFHITDSERDAVNTLLSGQFMDWGNLFSLLLSKKMKNVSDFLMSRDFFDILYEVCEKSYPQVPFTEMFWTLRSMILPLFQIIRESVPKADLYHSASTGYAGVIGSLGKHLYNKPYILTEHGIYTREREEEIIKADWIKGYFKDIWIDYFNNLSNCAYFYTDEVISLFERNREIQVELGCPEEKISIIPNGVEVSDFQHIPVNKSDDSRIHIGAIVRVVPIKDIKTMIQSFAIVKHDVPNACFHIFGPMDEEPEYAEECLQLIESLNLKDIELTGSVNVREYVGKMDMIVLTSISEGQPLAVLEAMACGKPLVTTDVGSCKELLHGRGDDELGKAGLVAPVMHYEQIGRCIIELCSKKEVREAMGRTGLQRVSQYYTRENFIDQYRVKYLNLRGAKSWQE